MVHAIYRKVVSSNCNYHHNGGPKEIELEDGDGFKENAEVWEFLC